ncbi:hypothetical protein F2S72_01695 [Pseudomonas syringae pv. actinidiae]|nr:hypothetical protein [Pseudomonas syringae pv. actinidiae]
MQIPTPIPINPLLLFTAGPARIPALPGEKRKRIKTEKKQRKQRHWCGAPQAEKEEEKKKKKSRAGNGLVVPRWGNKAG